MFARFGTPAWIARLRHAVAATGAVTEVAADEGPKRRRPLMLLEKWVASIGELTEMRREVANLPGT